MNENNRPPRTGGSGKVARTPDNRTQSCRLTRAQFDSLAIHEKIAVVFNTNISRKHQADFYNDPKSALDAFANSLPA